MGLTQAGGIFCVEVCKNTGTAVLKLLFTFSSLGVRALEIQALGNTNLQNKLL